MKKNILKWIAILFGGALIITTIVFFSKQQEKKEELAEIEAEEIERINELLEKVSYDFEKSKELYNDGNLSEAISEIYEGIGYATYLYNDEKNNSTLVKEALDFYNKIVEEYFVSGEGNTIYHTAIQDLTDEQVESFYKAYILLDEDALEKDLAAIVGEMEDYYNEVENKREQIFDSKYSKSNEQSKTQSPYTKEELENDPTAPSTNPNDYNANGEYVPKNGSSDNPADYSIDGEYIPVEEMTDEEIVEELNRLINRQ